MGSLGGRFALHASFVKLFPDGDFGRAINLAPFFM